ncbi:MAG: ATP-binding cassette domain-containing protein [Flavobacteriaceae bacterium]|nr:ATP-binding cassette domain-containing protein [Flavobacteriaceae bacterium]MDO7582061.1 ATP-binding cassette domain-containing protein [Flavobacteriaceae bacterium]MDO7592265.1 ATP-binding cassette domain-containing protein [Flavobacteriaceae bacterium]MDO7599111.1 ATP-binding cassette domain-containing protein [Flavobacteriaceae bacterium]MDO7603763.1 ATP-binding cassette domain-containing protein [Flavobacteriaceae bacterium]
MALIINQVKKKYGKIEALQGVSMALKAGEVVGLLGPNGAGKSTLMKILTGSIEQWNGTITYKDLDLRDSLKSIQQNTGYLPENNPLYGELFVLEYLHFTASLYKIKDAPFTKIIDQVGLTEYRNRKIDTLSKGYQQRVGLAAALLHNPEILILDEPTTGLDPNQMVEIRKLIRNLGKDKIVILSSHILSEVESVCDRVVIIKEGKLVADKNLEELRKGQQQVILVEFDYRVETEALSKIAHVTKVVNTFDFTYEIYFDTKEDMRTQVFDFARENELKILGLQLKNENLEQLFTETTT